MDARGRGEGTTTSTILPSSRRQVLLAGVVAVTALAGCSRGRQRTHAVVVTNRDGDPHEISVAVNLVDDVVPVFDASIAVEPGGRAKRSFRTRRVRQEYRITTWLDGNEARERRVDTLEEPKRLEIRVDQEGDLRTRIRAATTEKETRLSGARV